MQKCWVSFETAAHCRELDPQFFNKWLKYMILYRFSRLTCMISSVTYKKSYKNFKVSFSYNT